MKLVLNLNDIIGNLETLESYLTGSDKEKSKFAKGLIKECTDLLVYKVDGVNHFAPCIFCGYMSNTMEKHLKNDTKDLIETRKKIGKIVGKDSFKNNIMESRFKEYCEIIGLDLPDTERLYWRLYERGGYMELNE